MIFFNFFWVHSAKNAGKPKSRICLASTYRVLATCKVIMIKKGDGCARIKPRTHGGKNKNGEKEEIMALNEKKKEEILGFYDKVKWSGGDNRSMRDTEWLGYTSILSFFLSLPSFLSLFDEKLTQFQYLFLLFLYF